MSHLPALFLAHRYIARHERDGTSPPRWLFLLFAVPCAIITAGLAVLAGGAVLIAASFAWKAITGG